MDQNEVLESLKKGILVSGLSHQCGPDFHQNHVKYLYDEWRGNRLLVERKWGNTLTQLTSVAYSTSECLLPDDFIRLKTAEKIEVIKIATWNVNSIRIRLPLVLSWLAEQKPDIVCLQETKVEDFQYPEQELREAGYHSVYHGQKSYNGVAILSKLPIANVQYGFRSGFDAENKRLLIVNIEGINIVNVYVPQGQTPDSPKFQYKLEFLEHLQKEISTNFKPNDDVVLLGDINIAPDERDVVSPEAMKDLVSFHPREHAFLEKLKQWGLADVFRNFHSEGKLYSWWDFRTRGFEKNEGMRIDHIWVSPSIENRCETCVIDTNNRSQPKPSDHAPVICIIKV